MPRPFAHRSGCAQSRSRAAIRSVAALLAGRTCSANRDEIDARASVSVTSGRMEQGLLSEAGSDPRGRRTSAGNLLEDPDATGDGTTRWAPPAPIHRLGTCRKLSFAVGGVPNPITSIVTTFYLSPFLLEVARVRPATVGIIVLVGRVLDAFTDPLVGALSDHTKSRFGRRRPWMFFSIVPFACSFGALFWTWDIFGLELSSNATT